MTKAKRISLLALALLLMLSAVFMLAACGDGDEEETTAPAVTTAPAATTAPAVTTAPAHQHAYVDTVTPPTCTADGYTTHACSCGDSYTDTPVPSNGHSTVSKVTRYPTTLHQGIRRFDCTVCGHAYTDDIAVVTTFTLPSIAEALASTLPQGTYEIETEDASYTYLSGHEYTTTSYGEIIAEGAEYNNVRYAAKLAKLRIDVAAGVTAELTLDIGRVELPDGVLSPEEAKEFEIEPYFYLAFYLNGEDISIAINGAEEEEYKLSDEIYGAIAEAIGMPVEVLRDAAYIAEQMQSYAPIAEAIFGAFIGTAEGDEDITAEPTPAEEEIPAAPAALALLAELIVSAETDEDGITITTLDFSKLTALLAAGTDATVGDMIDNMYGEGTSTAFFTYLNMLPDMKIGDIVDATIAFSEAYEIDLDAIFALINQMVYLSTAVDIDLEAALLEAYDITLADVVIAANTKEMTAADVKAAMNALTLTLASDTIAELAHGLCQTDAPDTAHTKEECTALADMLTMIGTIADGQFDITVVTREVTEGEGEEKYTYPVLVSTSITTPFFTYTKDDDSLTVSIYPAPEYVINLVATADCVNLELIVESYPLLTLYAAPDTEEGDVIAILSGYALSGGEVLPPETDDFDSVPAPASEVTRVPVFSYGAQITPNGIMVFDIIETPGEFIPANMRDDQLVLGFLLEPTGFNFAIFTPASTEAYPAFALSLEKETEGAGFSLKFCIAPDPEYPTVGLLEFVPNENGFTATVYDIFPETPEVKLAVSLVTDADTGDFDLTVDPQSGLLLKLKRTVEEGVPTIAFGTMHEETFMPILTLTPAGFTFAMAMPSPDGQSMVESEISAELAKDGNAYTCTLTLGDLLLGSIRPDTEKHISIKKPENGEGTFFEQTGETEHIYVDINYYDAVLTFTYTAPGEPNQ